MAVADVVLIGDGAIGCAIARALTKRGRQVIVLEKNLSVALKLRVEVQKFYMLEYIINLEVIRQNIVLKEEKNLFSIC
jgi:predicted dinucleotide-binding enzyme